MTQLLVDPGDLAIVVIDVQPYFLDGWMAGESEPLFARLEFLLALATVYDLPLLATFEQPIETKGWLPERLEPFFPAHGQRFTKETFNCCGEPSILEAIEALGKEQLAVAGGETDVCVLQSVLGLIECGQAGLPTGRRPLQLRAARRPRHPPHGGRRRHPLDRENPQLRAAPLRRRAARRAALPGPRGSGLTLPEPEKLPDWTPGW